MKPASCAIAPLLVSALTALAVGHAAGATFQPIGGTLAIQITGHPGETTPAVIGAASLFDNPFPTGLDAASASQEASIPNPSRFNFSASASSITAATAPMGGTQATASVTFQQSFTTAAPQWLALTTEIVSPPTNPNVFATLTLTRAGQPAPIYVLGDTGGLKTMRQGFAAAGTFTLAGSINTTAAVPGSHTGDIAGSLLIAALADFNGDFLVNGADLPTWKNGYGTPSGAFASGNLDDNNVVDGADFLLWQRQYGTHAHAAAATAAVPEPAAAALGLAAFAALGCSRAGAYCRTNRSAARRAPRSPAR